MPKAELYPGQIFIVFVPPSASRIRYAPVMTRLFLIFSIVMFLTSCKNKQWNLNQTIDWKSVNPKNFTVLFVKWNEIATNAKGIKDKKNFDEAAIKELKIKKLDDQAENDDESETDLHFIVKKDYQKALAVILSVAKKYQIEQPIKVYQREYRSFDKWTDKIVYPE
jgi:hypothetical protein